MNLLYGEIGEVFAEKGLVFGKVRVQRVIKKIPLGLLTDAVQGDRVVFCDGVAISKVAGPSEEER